MAAISNPIIAGMDKFLTIDLFKKPMKVNIFLDKELIKSEGVGYLNVSFIGTSTVDETVTQHHYQIESDAKCFDNRKAWLKFIRDLMNHCIFNTDPGAFKYKAFVASPRHFDVPTSGIVIDVPRVTKSEE